MKKTVAFALTLAVGISVSVDASSIHVTDHHSASRHSAGFRVQSQLDSVVSSTSKKSLVAAAGKEVGPANSQLQQRLQSNPASSLRGGVVANTVSNAVAGAVALALIEKLVKQGLKSARIDFPGQLAACMALFASLLAIEVVSPSVANSIFNLLTPGSALLAKWLPVFFVPGLVLLPLSKPIGGGVEVCVCLYCSSRCYLHRDASASSRSLILIVSSHFSPLLTISECVDPQSIVGSCRWFCLYYSLDYLLGAHRSKSSRYFCHRHFSSPTCRLVLGSCYQAV
jgi:hypothetical protein